MSFTGLQYQFDEMRRSVPRRHEKAERPKLGRNRRKSQAEPGESRMPLRPRAERPAEQPLAFRDRMFVDAGEPPLHQTFGIELPILMAVGAEPGAAIVAILVHETYGDAVSGVGPHLLDQAIVQFARPLAGQELLDFYTAGDELCPTSAAPMKTWHPASP